MVRARFINDVTVIDVTSESEVKRVKLNLQEDHARLINRDMADQHPISAISGLETALEGKQDTLTSGENIQIEDGVISATDTTYTAGTGISIENGVISSTATSAEWGNIGGTLSNQTDLDNALNDLSGGIDSNHQAISSINQTISTYGNIVTHNTSEFATASQGALADTAVQPADLDDYTTKQYVDAGLSVKQDTISDLSTIRSGAALGATAIQPNDNISELNNNVGYITGITSSDVTTALGYTPYNSSNPSNYQTATQVANSITTETTNRENADNNLQSQIDAIVSSSDVFDIVGTYAELQAYDITTVPVNDIIKVLVDSTHSDAATYYRCVETGGVKSWSYIGSEGAYYTKGEADAAFVPQTRTVNSKALSSNITLTASDVGADVSGSASTAETNAKNYADGLSVNYATAAQGALAVTAVQPGDLSGYVTKNTAQDITARKTFFGEKAIYFKQSAATNKLGFTLYNNNNSEVGALEFRPNSINSIPILTLNSPSPSSSSVSYGIPYVGFRYWNYSLNILAPFSTSFGYNKNFFIPVTFTNGTTTVESTSTNGSVDISSLLPTVNNATLTITQGGTTKGTFTANASSNVTIDLDAGGGSSYTAGTGIDITNDVISVTSPTLTNTATGINSLVILGNETGGLFKYGITCIGYDSYVATSGTAVGYSCYAGNNGVALGEQASCQDASYSIALGFQAIVSGSIQYAIQLGRGTNSEANSFYVSTSASDNWKMLGSDGKIPSGRLPIVTSVSSSSTNSETVGAKLFYDTCGDIETLINAL